MRCWCLNPSRMHICHEGMLAQLGQRTDKGSPEKQIPSLLDPQFARDRNRRRAHGRPASSPRTRPQRRSPAARGAPSALVLVRGSSGEQGAQSDAVGGVVREPEGSRAPNPRARGAAAQRRGLMPRSRRDKAAARRRRGGRLGRRA